MHSNIEGEQAHQAEGVLKLVFLGLGSLSSSHCSYIKTTKKTFDIAEVPFKTKQIFLTKIKLETCKVNVYHKKTL